MRSREEQIHSPHLRPRKPRKQAARPTRLSPTCRSTPGRCRATNASGDRMPSHNLCNTHALRSNDEQCVTSLCTFTYFDDAADTHAEDTERNTTGPHMHKDGADLRIRSQLLVGRIGRNTLWARLLGEHAALRLTTSGWLILRTAKATISESARCVTSPRYVMRMRSNTLMDSRKRWYECKWLTFGPPHN